jgi:type I restriction enzyme S subunit
MFGNISHKYIVIYLKSPYVDNYVNAASYGVKMPRAGTETMTSLLVPIPPISEQMRIVAAVVSLLEPLKKL